MRSLLGVRISLSAIATVALLLGTARAQIPATDDSYTASSSPSNNYGTQSQLNVIGPGVNSYIRFDLSTLPAGLTSANISKATARLNINGVTTGGTFDVYLVTSSWTEGGLTFNNAPTLGTKVASSISVPLSKRNFIDVDVTSAVQAWFNTPNPSSNFGIALVPSSGSAISISFDSKENTSTSHDPELSVSLISAGPQGPKGDKGDPGLPGATEQQEPQEPQERLERLEQPGLRVRLARKGLRDPPALKGRVGSPASKSSPHQSTHLFLGRLLLT
jgi:hypothetical protein